MNRRLGQSLCDAVPARGGRGGLVGRRKSRGCLRDLGERQVGGSSLTDEPIGGGACGLGESLGESINALIARIDVDRVGLSQLHCRGVASQRDCAQLARLLRRGSRGVARCTQVPASRDHQPRNEFFDPVRGFGNLFRLGKIGSVLLILPGVPHSTEEIQALLRTLRKGLERRRAGGTLACECSEGMRALGRGGLGPCRSITGKGETGQCGQMGGGRFQVDSACPQGHAEDSNTRSEEFRVFHNNIIPWSKDEYDCLEYRVA